MTLLKGIAAFLLGVLLACGTTAGATVLQLRNADADQLLVYWVVNLPPSTDTQGLFDALPRGRLPHRVLAPGEVATLETTPDESLVLALVPWQQQLSPTTQVPGLRLAPAGLTAGKQISFEHTSFAASAPTGGLRGTLLDWGLAQPHLVLDGQFADWASIVPLARFGPDFASGKGPRVLQVTQADGALWFHLTLRRSVGGVAPGSLIVQASSRFWEIPTTGPARVWFFRDSTRVGTGVGSWVRRADELEAWIVLDRLAAEDREALLTDRLKVSWLVESPGSADNTFMTDFSVAELP